MTDKVEEKKSMYKEEMEPLIGETPTLTIKGKKYRVRRLGMVDTFRLARIVSIGAAGIGKEMSTLELTPEAAIGLLVIGFPYAEKHIIELFASLLDVKEEDMRDPNKFPMGSEIEIAKALINHIDVKAFFTKLPELLKIPMLKGFSKKTSTVSKKGTGGRIPK